MSEGVNQFHIIGGIAGVVVILSLIAGIFIFYNRWVTFIFSFVQTVLFVKQYFYWNINIIALLLLSFVYVFCGLIKVQLLECATKKQCKESSINNTETVTQRSKIYL